MALSLEHARTFPVDVDRAFDVVLPMPLPELFSRRYAAIPPIREVRDQQGPWARSARPARSGWPTAARCARR